MPPNLRASTCGVTIKCRWRRSNFREHERSHTRSTAYRVGDLRRQAVALPVQPNARHLGRPAARLLPDRDASCTPPIAPGSALVEVPPNAGSGRHLLPQRER